MRKPSDFFKVRVDTLKDMVNFSDEKKEKKRLKRKRLRELFVDEHAGGR